MSKASSPGFTTEEIERLSLGALNGRIAWARKGWETGGTSQGRRAFFKQLVWLEAQRERLHQVAAPKRRYTRIS